ncbi:MAG: FAD-dependent oxidoreductase, partial [Thermoleophilia bacterium]|nr:FAD-dependent oxidoreductase [Thermoleophilia bacterium]
EIDRGGKSLKVLDGATGREYDETYDRLVLAQGAAAVRPEMAGIDHPRIFSLRNIPDMDAVKALVDGGARTAVVVGAGYIGLETVEALVKRGLKVDLVELQDQILPTLDPEMAIDLRYHLEEKGVSVRLGAGVKSFRDMQGRVTVELDGGDSVCADLVIMAIGVTPESALAASAGLELGVRGSVKVDRHMRTSDPDIYAAGDMVEVTDTVTGEQTNIPLAGPANRQGRIAADNICGRDSEYSSTQGTAIVKVFDLTAALTGASEKALRRVDRRFEKIYLYPFGHAIYYPGTGHMHTKVLFDPVDGRILGAQIVGYDGVDKRIDVLAVAVRMGMTVHDLEEQELAYAPPYGSAKDAINMAGFVGANVLKGDVRFWFAEDHPGLTTNGTVLDVRTPGEYEKGHVHGAVLIPLDKLRGRKDELRGLPEPIYIYCLTGIRSYLAYRILHLNGFEDLYNLAGGWKSFERFHREELEKGGS